MDEYMGCAGCEGKNSGQRDNEISKSNMDRKTKE